jgi:hypothetical protein
MSRIDAGGRWATPRGVAHCGSLCIFARSFQNRRYEPTDLRAGSRHATSRPSSTISGCRFSPIHRILSTMPTPKPTPNDQCVVVAKAVYDHVRRARDDVDRYYEVYLGKVHKLMTVQVALFASMAYAVGQLDWIYRASGCAIWLVGTLASLGALSLAVGFASGLRCLEVGKTSVVGVKLLKKTLVERTIQEFPADQLYYDLSRNLLDGVIAERERSNTRDRWNGWLNRSTFLGFLLVAAFVGSAIVGNLVASVDENQRSGETAMNDPSETGKSQQPAPGGTSRPAASEGAPSPDPTSESGQAEDSQLRVSSAPPSLVEGLQEICLTRDNSGTKSTHPKTEE